MSPEGDEEPAPTKSLVSLQLSGPDLDALREVAHHYEKVMGVTRHVVVWTTSAHIRRKYRFIVNESNDLEHLIDEVISARDPGSEDATVEFELDSAVALWGRLLSNLRSRRSRRRLSKEAIAIREELTEKFARAIARFRGEDQDAVDKAVKTRRRLEAGWMTEDLAERQESM